MKQCKKCGEMINDNAGDLCENCLKGKNRFNNVEKAVGILSNVLLILGIVSSIIISPLIMVEKDVSFGGYSYSTTEVSPIWLVITVFTLFSSILFSMLLKMAVKTSVNIREIRDVVKSK